MAASDDIQFDMAAALVAVMVVLFELVWKDALFEADPPPGSFSLRILVFEEPATDAEMSRYGEVSFDLNSGKAVLPWPEFATEGAPGDWVPICSVDTGGSGPPNRAIWQRPNPGGPSPAPTELPDGGNLAVSFERSSRNFDWRLAEPLQHYSMEDSIAFRRAYLSALSTTTPIPAWWPLHILHAHRGHPVVVEMRDLADEPSFPTYHYYPQNPIKSGDSSFPKRLGLSLKVYEKFRIGWTPSNPLDLIGFLRFYSVAEIQCEGSGDAYGSAETIGLTLQAASQFANSAPPTGSEPPIRRVRILALSYRTSDKPEPLIWTFMSSDPPPFTLTPAPTGILRAAEDPVTIETPTLLRFRFDGKLPWDA